MGVLCIVGPIVATFFVLSDTARQYLIIMLIFTAFYVFAYSINTIIVCGIFPAGGDARYDAVSVFFASWCFALPLALLGSFVFRWPVMVVYILMNSDEIVKLHGGTLTIRSKLGEGTAVFVSVPAIDVHTALGVETSIAEENTP